MSEAGPLSGRRVVELASFWAAWAGKLFADLGADVVLVEPPGGHYTRRIGPFVGDIDHPERSLWWWYYNTSKRGVVIDLSKHDGVDDFRELVRRADLVLEAEAPGRLTELAIDYEDFSSFCPALVWTSVTSHGRGSSRSSAAWTDLTMSAASGIAWMNGYDDHAIPPMRARGNQTVHIAGAHAAMAALTALVSRDVTGAGQHVDVSVHAACNVSTESGTTYYLVSGDTVYRQTGRHAAPAPTQPVQARCADGRYVTTGLMPQTAKDFRVILNWLDDLAIRDSVPEAFFLEIGVARGGVSLADEFDDPEVMAICSVAREALLEIARRLPAVAFFRGAQEKDLQCGVILSSEEAFEDEHFTERGYQLAVTHDELGQDFRYPGAPFRMSASPWALRCRAPLIGEHNEEILRGAWV